MYVLKSKEKRKAYVGCTGDVEKRLKVHNQGKVKASKHYRPFALIHKEEFVTLREARERELFYKTTSGRRMLKKIFRKINFDKCPPSGHREVDNGEASPR